MVNMHAVFGGTGLAFARHDSLVTPSNGYS